MGERGDNTLAGGGDDATSMLPKAGLLENMATGEEPPLKREAESPLKTVEGIVAVVSGWRSPALLCR